LCSRTLIWQQQWAAPSSGIHLNSGQVCTPVRLPPHESIKDEFMQQLAAATKTIKLGERPTTTDGTVTVKRQSTAFAAIQADRLKAKPVDSGVTPPVEDLSKACLCSHLLMRLRKRDGDRHGKKSWPCTFGDDLQR